MADARVKLDGPEPTARERRGIRAWVCRDIDGAASLTQWAPGADKRGNRAPTVRGILSVVRRQDQPKRTMYTAWSHERDWPTSTA